MLSIYLLDWLSFTSKIHNPLEIISLLGLEKCNFQFINGMHGYADRLYYDGISIHFNGRNENMGVWCEMSGQGCRVFETLGTGDYNTIFRTIFENDGMMNVTRLDVAFDDHDGLLNISKIFDDTMKQNFSSRWKWYKHEAGSQGVTVYFGSPKSDIRLRIYDKARERNKEGHWIRVELQLRDERALAFIKLLYYETEEISCAFLGVIHNYLRFLKPNKNDTHKDRWATAGYWHKFIKSAAKIRIYEKPGIEYNLENLTKFVVNQAGGAIETYLHIFGERELKRQLEQRSVPLNPKYKELIDKKQIPNIHIEGWEVN